MKKIILFTAYILLLTAYCIAQAPEKINFQGVAHDVSGYPLLVQNIGIRFTIHSSSPNGVAVYQETHNTTTDLQGVFSLVNW